MGNFLMGIAKTISYIVTILIIIGVIYFYNTFIHKDYENVNIPEKDEMQYLRCEFPKSINTPNGNKDWKDSKNIRYSLFSIDIKKDVLKDADTQATPDAMTSTGLSLWVVVPSPNLPQELSPMLHKLPFWSR